MKLNEFKAWFEGFTEGMEGPPSPAQWERIQERIGEIDGKPIEKTVIERRIVEATPLSWPFRRYEPYITFGTDTGDAPSWKYEPVTCQALGAAEWASLS